MYEGSQFLASILHTAEVILIIIKSVVKLPVLHQPFIASTVAMLMLLMLQQRWSTASAILNWAR